VIRPLRRLHPIAIAIIAAIVVPLVILALITRP
jgi:hypothetical protein